MDEGDHLSSTGDDLGTFEEFRERTYREPWPGGAYIVDGDVAIADDAALAAFWAELQPGALAVLRSGGSDVKWNNTAKLNLTYCVSNNFGSSTQRIIDTMELATREWERRAAVDFIHVAAQDGSGCTTSNNNVVFNVQQVSVGGAYAARAFWPNDSRSNRSININVGTLGNTPAGLVGVLGHELGHALGFRHEHTRPEAGICFEDNDWRGLTTYDARSIMHYPQCNGGQNFIWWTEKDRLGAAALYGAGVRGDSDILWRHSNGSIAVWLMTGAAAGMGGSIAVGPGWDIHGNGDFDGDGKSDVLWRGTDGTLAIWFMNGPFQTGAAYPGTIALWWQILGVGDFNGDGRSDILWRDTGGQIAIWFMNGGVQLSAVYPGVLANRAVEGIGDFNRDGISDILWGPTTGNPAAGDRRTWLIDNGTLLADVALGTASAGWSVKGTGDFNGDNTADILWRHTDGTNAIWPLQDTPGSVTRLPDAYPPAVSTDWKIRGTGDFNGDWKTDILWRNDDGTTAIWFMNGAIQLAAGYPGAADNNWTIRGTGYFD